MTDFGIVIGPFGFAEILDHKSGAAEVSDELFEAMKVFGRAGLTVGGILLLREWSRVVVLDADHELLPFVAVADLQADGLLVL